MNKGGFIRKKVKTLTLGERLVKMREDRHVTISDVSKSTGIQSTYIEYLEQGLFEKLPAEVYVRGFLRRYAEYLSVADASILRQYDRERGMDRSMKNEDLTEQNSITRSAFQKIPSVIVTPRRITVTIFLLVAIAGFLYVYSEYRSFISEPVLLVVEPAQEVVQTKESSILMVGETDPDSRIFINDQPVLIDENGGFREKIDLQTGVNTVTVRSVNRFSKEAKNTYSINAEFEENKQESVVDETGDKKVVIRTGNEPVWVLITVDGEQKVSSVAPVGSRWEFYPKQQFLISAGDGRNVYATIGENGKESPLSEKEDLIEENSLDMEKDIFIPKNNNNQSQ